MHVSSLEEAFSLALLLQNPPRCKNNWLLKGTGDETLIGLLHVMPKTHPWLIKRIGTTLLDHALTVFPIIKLAKVHLRHAL